MIERIVPYLPTGLQWWVVNRYGDRPECETCGRDAFWYTTDEGYQCITCQEGAGFRIAMMRELEPEDYFDDI